MNREDIIRTAQEAGMVHDEDDDSFFSPSNLGMDVHINNLKRFAAIVAALEAKDEPVAWFWFDERDGGEWIHIADNQINADKFGNAKVIPLYTTPPQRKPLSEEEIGAILEDVNAYGTRLYTFARAIEAAHGIKGEA